MFALLGGTPSFSPAEEPLELFDLRLTRESLEAQSPGILALEFPEPLRAWNEVPDQPTARTVLFGARAGLPSKARGSVFSPGLSLYFSHGVKLRLRTEETPLLSWHEGSAGPDVPTPDSGWLLLSFSGEQPAILMAFYDGRPAFRVRGKPGDWVLENEEPYTGWVRFALPFGSVASPTSSAADLGERVAAFLPEESLWCTPGPNLLSFEVESFDTTSVTALWRFDRPGAVVPVALLLAPLGGYPIRLQSPIQRLKAFSREGPLALTLGTELRVRFPVRQILPGRPVLRELSEASGLPPTGPQDVFQRLAGDATFAETLYEGMRDPVRWEVERRDPGSLALYGLIGLRADPDDTAGVWPLFTQFFAEEAWRVQTGEGKFGDRRAAGIAAIASALRGTPEDRLFAARLQAGLAGERGRSIWLRRRGLAETEWPLLEAMPGVRRHLFSLERASGYPQEEAFAAALCSELRLLDGPEGRLEETEGQWTWSTLAKTQAPIRLSLYAPTPIEIAPAYNVTRLKVQRLFGCTQIEWTPYQLGECRLTLSFPEGAPQIPLRVEAPPYSEIEL